MPTRRAYLTAAVVAALAVMIGCRAAVTTASEPTPEPETPVKRRRRRLPCGAPGCIMKALSTTMATHSAGWKY